MTKPRRRPPVKTDRRYFREIAVPDRGPPERWQHSGRVFEPTDQAGLLAARATEEHVIDVLRLGGFIGQRASDAAFRLKQDFKRAGLEKHLVGSYNCGVQSEFGAGDRDDYEEAAYRRWRNALRAVGMLYSNAVVSVVCHDQWPEGRTVACLQKGLGRLADWYGLPESGAPDAPAGRSGDNVDNAAAR
ncbi:MAG: DUF6456 domain-containing protein [Bdellovibrionales bacterium]